MIESPDEICWGFFVRFSIMKIFLLTIFLSLSSISSAQSSDCDRLRTGLFSMQLEGHGTVFFERGTKTQIESGGNDGLKLLYRLKWESPCVYTLKVKKVLSNPANLYVDKKAIVRVEITEVKEKSYLVHLTVSKSDFEFDGEVFIVQ